MSRRKAKEEKAKRQDEKDKKRALKLFNKYYKDDLETKGKKGKNAVQQQCLKHTKQLEQDFTITNQLTEQEKREWADLFKKADEEDKVAKKDVEDITCVKEMMQLKYVPEVWADGDKPN